MNEAIIDAKALVKVFPQGAGELTILQGLDLQIKAGESVGIVGASGSGKSTLVHVIGTLDRPTSGSLSIGGREIINMPDEELARFRNEEMGFVFQFHHLLSEFTALENVALPGRIGDLSKEESQQRAEELLVQVGLKDRVHHYPNELSGGELQRVAIARALSRRPRILFADEPTGNLDSKNSLLIQDLFFQLKESLGLTLVVVTHDLNFARRFQRVLRLADGRWVQV